ncbi:DUF4344 domain-containing metallopeptidase [Acinetobacter guillouiae]|uniref:DUF4344 domain-containing metallopeptidase n=1 Tax=Acinetobacter guillouiae TaxID=106649 RepID=UPI00300A2D61
MNKNIPLTLKSCLISLVLISIVGCGTSADSSNNQSEINQQKQTPSSSNQHKKHAAKDQTGKFIAIYQPARNAQTKIEEKFWRSNYLLEDFAEYMNSYINIPQDIKVIAKECGEVNAFYDADTSTIEMCYELGEEQRELFSQAGAKGTELEDELFQSALGTLYHEAGHALIDTLALDIPYKFEEDYADQVAAYILTTYDEDKDYLISISDSYGLEQQGPAVSRKLTPEGHSPEWVRAENFLCYVYGSDSQKYAYLVKEKYLPKSRALGCKTEYSALVQRWDALLKKHLK